MKEDAGKSSIPGLIDGLKRKDFSAVELCKAVISTAGDRGKKLNAFITITGEKALKQAKAVDRRIALGEDPGLLTGVPVALKDNICYRDYPTTCASHVLNGFVPPYDSTCAKKLVDAGAVIVGKTNMDEFGMGSSNENSYYGAVVNPVGEDLVAGGSSGGSAAAVAANIIPVAFGSETGGSVRQPASFCGIYGLKPSYGSVSRYGLVAFASSMDQIGPFARNVYDLALAFHIICGHDANDSTSVAFEHPNYPESIKTDRKFKIGIPGEYFGGGLDRDVARSVHKAIDRLKEDGHRLMDVSLPHSSLAIAAYYVIANAEASSNLARYDGVRYGLRKEGRDFIDMYCRTRSEGFGSEVKRRIMLGTYVLSAGYYETYYSKAQQVRQLIRRDFEKVFSEVDLLITPTSPTAAFRMGEKINDPLAMYLSDVFTAPVNLAGIPAVSVPFRTVPDGRPVGVQFIAPAFDELSLFQIAGRLETCAG